MARRDTPDLRPYFDAPWYAATYGAGKRWLVGRVAWFAYRRRGRRKGHSPCALFDAAWYLAHNCDVRAAGLDPLDHYVTHGWHEGRKPCPLFDPTWYRARYPDVDAGGHEPLLHYLSMGWRQGARPHPAFDAAGYLARYPDVDAAGLEPLGHYLAYGWREGRNPHPLFDVRWYLDRNPDVARAGVEPLGHYLTTGWREGREVSPWFASERYAALGRPRRAEPNPFVRFLIEEYEPVVADVVRRATVVAKVMPLRNSAATTHPAAAFLRRPADRRVAVAVAST